MFTNYNQKNIPVQIKSVPNPATAAVPCDGEDRLRSVIRRYDTDGDGLLSRKELKKAFKSLGSQAPGWRAIRALCHADKNRDGFISDKELANLVQYAAKRGYAL